MLLYMQYKFTRDLYGMLALCVVPSGPQDEEQNPRKHVQDTLKIWCRIMFSLGLPNTMSKLS